MLVLSLLNGSRLYGTQNEDSDYDIINIYVKHRKDYYLQETVKTVHRKIPSINYEIIYIDLIKFCKFLIRGNPNFLIPMWLYRPLYETEIGNYLWRNSYWFYDSNNIKVASEGMCQSLEQSARFEKKNIQKRIDFIRNTCSEIIKELHPSKKTDYNVVKYTIDNIMTRDVDEYLLYQKEPEYL